MVNWIPDTNRWNLPKPPPYVLTSLWNFDEMLVVVPSRKEREYLLVRRQQRSTGYTDVVLLDDINPDMNMAKVNHVVVIAPLVFKDGAIKWTQKAIDDLIAELKRRDTWAITGGPTGNPDLLWKDLEDEEERARLKRRATRRDNFHHMGRDAWRSFTARMGARNKRASDGWQKPQLKQRVTIASH